MGYKLYTNLSPNVTKLEIQIGQRCLLFITLHIRRSLRKIMIFAFRTEGNALIKCSPRTTCIREPFMKRLPTETLNFLRFSTFYNSRHTHSKMLEIPINILYSYLDLLKKTKNIISPVLFFSPTFTHCVVA